jgi:hypothetical protein
MAYVQVPYLVLLPSEAGYMQIVSSPLIIISQKSSVYTAYSTNKLLDTKALISIFDLLAVLPRKNQQ